MWVKWADKGNWELGVSEDRAKHSKVGLQYIWSLWLFRSACHSSSVSKKFHETINLSCTSLPWRCQREVFNPQRSSSYPKVAVNIRPRYDGLKPMERQPINMKNSFLKSQHGEPCVLNMKFHVFVDTKQNWNAWSRSSLLLAYYGRQIRNVIVQLDETQAHQGRYLSTTGSWMHAGTGWGWMTLVVFPEHLVSRKTLLLPGQQNSISLCLEPYRGWFSSVLLKKKKSKCILETITATIGPDANKMQSALIHTVIVAP